MHRHRPACSLCTAVGVPHVMSLSLAQRTTTQEGAIAHLIRMIGWHSTVAWRGHLTTGCHSAYEEGTAEHAELTE